MSECQHPPALVHITDAGLSLSCTDCGIKRRLPPQMRVTINAILNGDAPTGELGEEQYGPTLETVSMQAARLDFALRSMGKAFWHGDHTPKQEAALELAVDASRGFMEIDPGLRHFYDAAIARFPAAERVA